MVQRFLMRKLYGIRSNASAGLVHHHRKMSTCNSIQTQTQTLTLTLNPSPYSNIPKLPFSSSTSPYTSPNLLLRHRRGLSSAVAPGSVALPSSIPPKMVTIRTVPEYMRAVKQVEDGRLPAVFFFYLPMLPAAIIHAFPTLRMLREKYPHVTIYQSILNEKGIAKLFDETKVIYAPCFHFYQNGRMVAAIGDAGDEDSDDQLRVCFTESLINAFEELYRYVIPVKSTEASMSSGLAKRAQQLVIESKEDENGKSVPTSSSGMEETTQEHVIQAIEKDETRKRVVRGRKVRGYATLSHHSIALALPRQSVAPALPQQIEAVESRGCAPSLDQVMQDVEALPLGGRSERAWWFAKGLFKVQPEKRVIFSKLESAWDKRSWLLDQSAEE